MPEIETVAEVDENSAEKLGPGPTVSVNIKPPPEVSPVSELFTYRSQ